MPWTSPTKQLSRSGWKNLPNRKAEGHLKSKQPGIILTQNQQGALRANSHGDSSDEAVWRPLAGRAARVSCAARSPELCLGLFVRRHERAQLRERLDAAAARAVAVPDRLRAARRA
eukprot:5921082-Pleurochrysis_carterae.AAC.1